MTMTVASDFPLLGEPLALDLVNTRVHRNAIEVDLLDSPAALTAWLLAERPRLAWVGAANGADLEAVRTLRGPIADLLLALRKRARPSADSIAAVNHALSNTAGPPRLSWTATRPQFTAPRARSRREALLHTLAADAVALVTGPDARRVRQCAHPDCILQFVARNPRRRWCSAELCGNRARVARHYLRQREAG